MTTTALRTRRARDLVVLLLGASTMAIALLAGTLFETYEGPGLVSYKTVGAAGLSFLLLIGTVVAFARAARLRPPTRPLTVALILATSAYPLTFVLAATTLTVLNALGIYW